MMSCFDCLYNKNCIDALTDKSQYCNWNGDINNMSNLNDVRKHAIVMLCKGSRKAQRLTLVAAGNRTNYHYTTLSKFEHGYRFSWDMAEAYAKNILNPAERATYEKIKGDILNGR